MNTHMFLRRNKNIIWILLSSGAMSHFFFCSDVSNIYHTLYDDRLAHWLPFAETGFRYSTQILKEYL